MASAPVRREATAAVRRTALLVALGLACGLQPPDGQQGGGDVRRQAVPPAGYQLVWEERFDGSSLDPARWTALAGPRRSGYVTPAAVSVAGGLATLTTYTEGGVHYTGFLSTEGKFAARYGYFEARIRFHDAPGSWCAFWISTYTVDDSVGNPGGNGTEIDVVEHRVTDPGGWTELADMVALNVNWDGYGPDKKTAQLVTQLPDGTSTTWTGWSSGAPTRPCRTSPRTSGSPARCRTASGRGSSRPTATARARRARPAWKSTGSASGSRLSGGVLGSRRASRREPALPHAPGSLRGSLIRLPLRSPP
jgi:hypothetical protein